VHLACAPGLTVRIRQAVEAEGVAELRDLHAANVNDGWSFGLGSSTRGTRVPEAGSLQGVQGAIHTGRAGIEAVVARGGADVVPGLLECGGDLRRPVEQRVAVVRPA